MGVNVTGASGRGKPRRHRNEGLEVTLLMTESSAPLAASAEDGPASTPVPLDRFAAYPPMLQEALTDLADAVQCSAPEDRELLRAWLAELMRQPGVDGAAGPMRALRAVADAVVIHAAVDALAQQAALTKHVRQRVRSMAMTLRSRPHERGDES